jgi:hypothetical protein
MSRRPRPSGAIHVVTNRRQGKGREYVSHIGLAVGAVANHWKVRKHLDIQITDTTLSFSRKHSQIDAEAALDGFYILRTGVSETELPTADVVRSYKQLNAVERGFRTLKGPELQIRPIHHRLEQRVPAHVFLYMLAYYLTWHLLEAWKPLLFTDEQPTPSPDPSPRPHAHLSTRESADQAQHSRRAAPQLQEPARRARHQTRNTIRLPGTQATFDKLAEPNPGGCPGRRGSLVTAVPG